MNRSSLWTLLIFALLPASGAMAGITDLKDSLYDQYDLDAAGFVETRGGVRTSDDPYEKDYSLAEARIQLDLSKDMDWGVFKIKGDFLADGVVAKFSATLREANLIFSPLASMDIKAGRQILTWGTGDLLFINDMFPKDWQSFFIGRDDEYLKAPSDAIKTSYFTKLINIDLVWTPVFNPSDHISGERLSYWNNSTHHLAGRNYVFGVESRSTTFTDSEIALRLTRNIDSLEMAIYGYVGFWKEPEGMAKQPPPHLRYPRLAVYGGSLRAPMAKGIGNVEIGYYDSREDRDGTDPYTRNSELRILAGYEQELGHNFTGSGQYYLEYIQDYEPYKQGIVDGRWRDKYRHLLTIRLTKLLMNQNLILSLFTYYSPNDRDAYIRPKIQYKMDDHWLLETGGNIFKGNKEHTFWGQFENNSNIYASARWSF